jgi:hypothetical protein
MSDDLKLLYNLKNGYDSLTIKLVELFFASSFTPVFGELEVCVQDSKRPPLLVHILKNSMSLSLLN